MATKLDRPIVNPGISYQTWLAEQAAKEAHRAEHPEVYEDECAEIDPALNAHLREIAL